MICGEIDCGTLARVWLFGRVVDHSAAGSDAAFQSRDAFDDFYALFVLKRDVLFSGDGQAVDLEAGREVDRESANLEIAVVSNRRIILADCGIILHDVRQHPRYLITHYGAGHVSDRK